MHTSVKNALLSFQTRYEGRVEHLYLDPIGLVTVGIGNLVEKRDVEPPTPTERCLTLPFVLKADATVRATHEQIRAEWRVVKSIPMQTTAEKALRLANSRSKTKLRLLDPDIDRFLHETAEDFARTLTNTTEFASFETWPADAQLAIMSMAWGMGPSFATEGRWPNFRSACADRRWAEAADHCRFKPDESSIRHRNDKNQELFRTAARVVAENLDPTEIHTSLAASTGSGLPTLRQGDSSNRVLVLQHLLRAHSVDIAADGSFGPKTLAAVRVFQTRSGLTSDGVVGGNTWRALAVFALQTGSQGDAVKAAQICLGHTPPTGDFVEETTTAVEFFQADHGLPINGHVDAATWLALIGRK